LLNNVAHKWAGKGGPAPVTHPSHFAFWGGMATGEVGVNDFVDFERFDFRPAKCTDFDIVLTCSML